MSTARYLIKTFLGREPKMKIISRGISSRIKTYDEIPSINNGLINPRYLHEHCDNRHKQLGPIFKEKLGLGELVFLADTKLIQIVMANEGQFPHHNVPSPWLAYNVMNHIERGLFFKVGEQWAKLRKIFNKLMLSESNINKFSDGILDINSDLFRTWVTDKIPPKDGWIQVDELKMELCKWSIEATGFILFGNRMGCIPSPENPSFDSRAEDLVKNVSRMFIETTKLQLVPVHKYNRRLEAWREFEDANSKMLKLAGDYANENMTRVKSASSGDSLLRDLLNSKELTDKEISLSLIDLIIASSDTTSNSLQWMFYILGKHENEQEKIFNEIGPLFNNSAEPNELKENTPYIRAFVREVMRLYPTAPFLARTLIKSIDLGGYNIPAGRPIAFSLYTTSRKDEYFAEPLEFMPERWIRSNTSSSSRFSREGHHGYASLPFGMGARNCIGRRVSELQLCLILASFISRFKLRLIDHDITTVTNMILCPSKPIKIEIKPR